jgi:hypothetical protein
MTKIVITEFITAVKSFMIQSPGANVTNFTRKLECLNHRNRSKL